MTADISRKEKAALYHQHMPRCWNKHHNILLLTSLLTYYHPPKTQPLSHILVVAIGIWNDVIECDDVQSGFDLFYAIAHELLDHYYPQSSITVGERDPSFVTPLIKKLLRKRNKLMRSGKIEKAEAITQWVISQCVISRCQSACSNLQRGSKQMWDKVREIRGKQASNRKSLSVNISDLNRHYASISTDPNYTSPNIKHSVIHNDETHFFWIWSVYNVRQDQTNCHWSWQTSSLVHSYCCPFLFPTSYLPL